MIHGDALPSPTHPTSCPRMGRECDLKAAISIVATISRSTRASRPSRVADHISPQTDRLNDRLRGSSHSDDDNNN